MVKKLKQTTTARRSSFSSTISTLLAALAFLLDDYFVLVADTLTLVRLRRTLGADDRRKVTDLNLVVAAHHHLGVRRALHRDALRQLHDARVGVTEGKVQVLPLHRRLVTDTEELQFLLETGRNPDHHVVGERAVQAVALARLRGVVRATDLDRAILFREHHRIRERHLQTTLRTLFIRE